MEGLFKVIFDGMMARVMSAMLWGLMLFMAASCKDMKAGKGIRAVVRGDVLTTLDGDTFDIQDKIGDSVLIVRQRPKRMNLISSLNGKGTVITIS